MERPWAEGAGPEQAPLFSEEGDVSRPAADVADTGEFIAIGANVETPDPPAPAPPARPHLQRNAVQAAPPAPSPAPDPPQSTAVEAAPTDSLSLLQLRRIVAEVNRVEQPAYDFEYSDMGPHAEELDEWFSYQFWQWMRLTSAQRAFEWHWENENSASCKVWDDADNDTRARFVQSAIAGVQSNDAALRSASIGKLVYLVLGRWGDTAMPNATSGDSQSVASISQLRAIKAGVECLTSLEGLPVIWEALKNSFELHWSGDAQQAGSPQEAQDELVNLMTILYVCIQETLNDPEDMSSAYNKLLDLNPSLVDFMMTATSKLRWDDHNTMPHTQIFLLFWKSILLVFGGSKEIQTIKKATSEQVNGLAKETIAASPLDYHVFRQEITSKYPAYIPPQPKIPLEAENTSLLPPLPNHTTRTSAANGITPFNANAQNVGSSILNQPVHIATPAPSPPPSPAVGGKGGKKQNYQTNQNFPFMYPPLDATSNSAGGKGMSDLQQALVSRKWEGSDIPASILEAGELFSSRVRMTRATKQLWDEREKFLRYERGWDEDVEEDEIDDLDLNELSLEEREIIKELKAEQEREKKPPMPADSGPDFGPRAEQLSPRDRQRLEAVERFYRDSLPHLQSLVIVLLRPILANVTAIVAQQPNQQQPGQMGRGMNPGVNGGQIPQRPQDGTQTDSTDLSPEDIDAARTREVTSKAMTAILLLLLKWLRLSHVLKFEYLTQLLLDSNYIPLVLKLFAHQDIQQVVDSKTDRVENSFFHFCNLRSKSKESADADGLPDDDGDLEDDEIEDGSEDEAVPPPIKRRPNEGDDSKDEDQGLTRPEVDELGYPVTSLPEEPITDFSRRNFFSLINYLRVMQKICKNKSHRNLLLVQYKSSTIIRKSLKVPQPELRLYTLKLFKGQVPYCGRKWRQGNMRVITAVYLHCRPELRDEWLAGSDIDSDVDSALPLEQALRGLTHWYNLRRYPDKIAPEILSVMREEHDFFTRELEKLDFNWADVQADDGMSELDHVEGWA